MGMATKAGLALILVPLLLIVACAPALGDTELTLTTDFSLDWLGPLTLSYDDGFGLDSLYLRGQIRDYRWRLGVMPVEWGPSPGEDLLFSGDRGLPLAWVSADYRGFAILPALHYENFYARLQPRGGSDRYLIGRRYTTGNERWQAGLTEIVLLSGDFSPYYLIPYPFFPISVGKVFLTESQVGDPKDANMLYGLDLKYRGPEGTAYAALLIDEAPLTPAWEGPWRIGLQLGGERKSLFGRNDLGLWAEYTAVSRYTYTYHTGYARGDYVDGDQPLGHSLGPDADLLRFRLTRQFEGWSGWLELAQERRGEGRFGDRWDPARGQTLEFLTGTVETSSWLKVGSRFTPLAGLTLDLALAGACVANLDNIEGQTGTRMDLSIKVTYEF